MIKFFKPSEEAAIIAAIRAAERNTTGEIRVHLEDELKGNALEEAVRTFRRLKMHATERHNGVIIFLAPNQKKFAIYGDEGINNVVPEGFWDDVRDLLGKHFRTGAFTDGVVAAIHRIGENLKVYFPGIHDDINELPDDISYA